jgi:hypothetical protein
LLAQALRLTFDHDPGLAVVSAVKDIGNPRQRQHGSGSPAQTPSSFEANAQARGFSGYAGTAQAATAAKARSAAIAQCIAKGGVPACCRKNSSAKPP